MTGVQVIVVDAMGLLFNLFFSLNIWTLGRRFCEIAYYFVFVTLRVNWVRNLGILKHCVNYFPIDLVKTANLTPDRNYLICLFPHGMGR